MAFLDNVFRDMLPWETRVGQLVRVGETAYLWIIPHKGHHLWPCNPLRHVCKASASYDNNTLWRHLHNYLNTFHLGPVRHIHADACVWEMNHHCLLIGSSGTVVCGILYSIPIHFRSKISSWKCRLSYRPSCISVVTYLPNHTLSVKFNNARVGMFRYETTAMRLNST